MSRFEEFETLREGSPVELLQRELRKVKIDRALDSFIRGDLSFEAAEQAGVSRTELSHRAYAHGLEPSFSVATLSEELGEISPTRKLGR
jgi:hypothetical protein